jgi:hypothetical protein
MMVALLVTFDV